MTPQDVLQTGTQRTIAPRTHPYSPYVPVPLLEPEGREGFWAGQHTAGVGYGFYELLLRKYQFKFFSSISTLSSRGFALKDNCEELTQW